MNDSDLRSSIKLVLFDVDGVLTDGTLWIGEEGEIVKPFNVKDGVAAALLRQFGIRTGVLSAKASVPLKERAAQLNLDVVKLGFHHKLEALAEICAEQDITVDEIAFVGDDIIDIAVLGKVGVSYAPRDAHALVLESVQHITQSAGGQGVMREVAEDILKQRGLSLADMYRPMLDQAQTASRIVQ